MRPALLLNAAELLRQPGTVRFVEAVVPLAELDVVDERISGEVSVAVTATSSLDDVVVTGTLTVPWSDACRRCLRPLADVLRVDVEERYVPGGDADDPDAFPIEHNQIDLAPMVREDVLLGIPDAPLCRSDCPGLCPVCGADLQTAPCDCTREVRDERWAVLDQLRDDA